MEDRPDLKELQRMLRVQYFNIALLTSRDIIESRKKSIMLLENEIISQSITII
jgi:hypothetical protein